MVGTILTLVYDEARRIWCYRWVALGAAALIFALAAAYITAMPNTYDAWAQIFVNKQPPAAVAAQGVGLVGDNYGSPYVVEKTLLNDQNLEPVVRKLDPSAATFSKPAMAIAVNRLKSKIKISTD